MSNSRPKRKAKRNEPLLYEETKIQKGIWITPSTWDKMKQVAESEGVSISELVERWGRQLKEPAACKEKLRLGETPSRKLCPNGHATRTEGSPR